MRDTFYRITKNHVKLMRECLGHSLRVFIERHDERKIRVTDATSFAELMLIFNEQQKLNKMHWIYIRRHGGYCNFGEPEYDNKPYFEVGGCTLGLGLDYFLFIYLTEEAGKKILNKYKLKEL